MVIILDKIRLAFFIEGNLDMQILKVTRHKLVVFNSRNLKITKKG